MKKKLIQWSVMTLLGLWGFASFIILCGEDDPQHPVSEAAFIGYKVAAMISLYICYRVGRVADRKGLLPEIKEPDAPNPMKLED